MSSDNTIGELKTVVKKGLEEAKQKLDNASALSRGTAREDNYDEETLARQRNYESAQDRLQERMNAAPEEQYRELLDERVTIEKSYREAVDNDYKYWQAEYQKFNRLNVQLQSYVDDGDKITTALDNLQNIIDLQDARAAEKRAAMTEKATQ